MNDIENRSFPRTIECGGVSVELRRMTGDDAAAVLAFAQSLSTHDLLFLRRDISQPKVVAAWLDAERNGLVTTLLAVESGRVAGCATIVRDALAWSGHVGELRVIVTAALRGKGLGQKLTQECFALALEMGLEKMTAQMTADQSSAIAVFEGLGFRAEALLHDHVKDREGAKHDIVILSHDVAQFHAQMHAYGLTSAV